MPTEDLWVDGFDATATEWTTVGASPWLGDDAEATHFYSWDTGTEMSWFSFADSGVGAGAINSVTLYLKARWYGSQGDGVNVHFQATGVGDTDEGTITPTTDVLAWYTLDIGCLTTWTHIDSAEMKLIQEYGGGNFVDVSDAYLRIDYTPAGGLSIPVAMNHYNMHINKKIRGG